MLSYDGGLPRHGKGNRTHYIASKVYYAWYRSFHVKNAIKRTNENSNVPSRSWNENWNSQQQQKWIFDKSKPGGNLGGGDEDIKNLNKFLFYRFHALVAFLSIQIPSLVNFCKSWVIDRALAFILPSQRKWKGYRKTLEEDGYPKTKYWNRRLVILSSDCRKVRF